MMAKRHLYAVFMCLFNLVQGNADVIESENREWTRPAGTIFQILSAFVVFMPIFQNEAFTEDDVLQRHTLYFADFDALQTSKTPKVRAGKEIPPNKLSKF